MNAAREAGERPSGAKKIANRQGRKIAVLNKWEGKTGPSPSITSKWGAVGQARAAPEARRNGRQDRFRREPTSPVGKSTDPLLMVRGLDISKHDRSSPRKRAGTETEVAQEQAVLIPGVVMVTGNDHLSEGPGFPARTAFHRPAAGRGESHQRAGDRRKENLKAGGPVK